MVVWGAFKSKTPRSLTRAGCFFMRGVYYRNETDPVILSLCIDETELIFCIPHHDHY